MAVPLVEPETRSHDPSFHPVRPRRESRRPDRAGGRRLRHRPGGPAVDLTPPPPRPYDAKTQLEYGNPPPRAPRY
nr:hypothetical protein [Methylobacterium aquaticum]